MLNAYRKKQCYHYVNKPFDVLKHAEYKSGVKIVAHVKIRLLA